MYKRVHFSYFGTHFVFIPPKNFGNTFVVAKDKNNNNVFVYKGYYKDVSKHYIQWFSYNYCTRPKPMKKKLLKELKEVSWDESLRCYVIINNAAQSITPEKSELLRFIYG